MKDGSKIKKYLPVRYREIVQERLKEKTGKEWNLVYISQVFTGNRNNPGIFNEIVLLAAEEKAKLLETQAMIESLS